MPSVQVEEEGERVDMGGSAQSDGIEISNDENEAENQLLEVTSSSVVMLFLTAVEEEVEAEALTQSPRPSSSGGGAQAAPLGPGCATSPGSMVLGPPCLLHAGTSSLSHRRVPAAAPVCPSGRSQHNSSSYSGQARAASGAAPPVPECSGTISAHCNLRLLSSSNSPAPDSQVAGIIGIRHHTRLIFVFLVETGFYHVVQAGLELLTSATQEAEAEESLEPGKEVAEFKTSLANMAKPVSTKNTKISQVWWCVPVIPATQEAETGELFEPRGRTLHCQEPTPILTLSRVGSVNYAFDISKLKGKELNPHISPVNSIKYIIIWAAFKIAISGWAQWLTPVITTLWEAKLPEWLRWENRLGQGGGGYSEL
ncbi:hypothetical protein AAY473_020823 [Plecturocebus cupreus]